MICRKGNGDGAATSQRRRDLLTPPFLVFLQPALDHEGHQVREASPFLSGDGEEVFMDALGEGDGGALGFALQELEARSCVWLNGNCRFFLAAPKR